MTDSSAIERVVMRRVYRVRALERFIAPASLALVLLLLSLWGIGREVWVARVFENAPSFTDVSASLRFWLGAVINTRLVVQALMAVALIAAASFVRAIVRLAAVPPLRAA